jgi:hypothetical protein
LTVLFSYFMYYSCYNHSANFDSPEIVLKALCCFKYCTCLSYEQDCTSSTLQLIHSAVLVTVKFLSAPLLQFSDSIIVMQDILILAYLNKFSNTVSLSKYTSLFRNYSLLV